MCKRLPVFLSIFILIFITTKSSDAGIIQLPQTGQTRCYDVTGADIPCAGTGQDGEIRAGIAWPAPRFRVTYCNADAPCADQSSDCDGNASTDIVTDDLTGLIWPVNGNLAGKMDWNAAIDYAGNLTLCSYANWNLPNINELESLVNADMSLNGQGLTNVQAFYYWSSTTSADHSDFAWIVNLWYGGVVFYGKYMDNYVLPVHSGQSGAISLPVTGQNTIYRTGDDGDLRRGVSLWPASRFSNNGAGAVTDNLTGLMWLKDANCIKNEYPQFDNDIYWGAAGDGAVSWQHALDFVKDINNLTYPQCGSGFQDWRLPDTREILSLIDYSNFNPVLPTGHPFTSVQSYIYWTSTTSTYLPSNAWIAGLLDGGMYNHNKDDASYVWPVRSVTGNDNDNDGYSSDVDCNDNDADIHPGADEICDGQDNDCNADTTDGSGEQWFGNETHCGAGLCSSSGSLSCLEGQQVDTCVAGTPAADDVNCNGVDEDCDGTSDEEYAVTQTLCGVGVCASSGQKTCVNGAEVDSCIAGIPTETPEVSCDGLDNDCDGSADEGPDADGDGITDCFDNCRLVRNSDQNDDNATDDDNLNKAGIQHYGDMCDPDFDNDGMVTLSDYATWRKYYRQAVPPAPSFADLDNDNLIGLGDYAIWRKYYRNVPGPGVE